MTECTSGGITFSSVDRKKLIADFDGGHITSDAGAVLLREVDRRIGLIDAINGCIPDPRNQEMIVHDQRTLLAQRILAIALGYEDLNDHQTLRDDVHYILGLARNAVLERLTEPYAAESKRLFDETGEKQRLFDDLSYAAGTWDRERRVIVKAEHLEEGPNTRLVVTNLPGDPRDLYDDLYCQRGEMENRIKEQQLDLFADRTSCHDFMANQFRLLLSAAAYVLMETLRRTALNNTELQHAQVGTIRLKLLKIGARVKTSVRRIVLHLATGFPLQDLFRRLAERLTAPARSHPTFT